MNTLVRRLLVDAKPDTLRRIGQNPDEGYCCAYIKLGPKFIGRVFCSFRAKPDGIFCGGHDHLYAVLGEDVEEWIATHGLTLEEAILRSFGPRARYLDLRLTPFDTEEPA